MTIGTNQKNRMVRRDLVELLPGRELRRLPKGLIPAASSDPRPACGLLDEGFHYSEELFQRVGAFQIQAQFTLANPEDVELRFSQPRHDGVLANIDRPRCLKFSGPLVRANENEAAVFHRHGP